MLERQIMFKQLQELQRQKKLEELNDGRQQNVMDQKLSLMHYKQSSGTQYPLLNNGIPVRDASQMFKFGNTNLLHGLSNKLAQNQTISNEPARLLTKDNSQVNNHDRYASSRFSEKMENVGNNQDLASLDPLEQKILFNMEDNSWGASFGKHGIMGTESFENTDHSKDVPSLQSGSWSALMQSAVAEASSGDAGIQEEWSGSSYQNPELSNENQPSNIVGSGKHPTPWLYNKLPKPELISSIQHSDAKHKSPKEAGQGFLPDIPKNFIDRSAGFPAPNSTGQASHGTQIGYTNSAPITKAPKAEPDDAFTPSYENVSRSQCFGLKLASLQPGHSSKPFQDPQSNNNHLRNQNYMTSQETSHLVSVKNEDGQQSSNLEAKQRPMTAEMGQQNTWVDVPVQQNPFGMGSCEPPGNLETNAASGLSVQGELEAFGCSLKQADARPHNHSLVNPTNYDPSRRAVIKIERVTCDDKIPQATSLSQLNSAYGNYKNHLGSSAATGDKLVKSSSQPPLQVASIDQCGSAGTISGTNTHSRSFYSQHLNVANQNMAVLKSKKRKWPTFDRLPWHKEVTEGCLGLHDMSAAEMEWAQSANRLPEKIEIIQQLKEEARKVAHSLLVVQPKRRFVITTQLMQLLFRPPAVAPSEDATAHCDTVTYYAAKLALGDACSLVGHSLTPHDISGSSSRTSVIPKNFDHLNLSKTVEGLIDRSRRLEDELLRLEKGESSMLDVRVEFQDLDKISVINRFAKFHGRGPLVTADTASSGGASTVPKLYPLRYVTARPMPKMVPEGQRCLSLK